MHENWIKILETIKEDEILEYLKKEFEEKDIKYKIELEENWKGIRTPNYIGKFVVYVQEQFESETENILNRYYENIIEEDKIQEIDENEEDETEKESRKIAQKQKMIIKIYIGIVICMIISFIIAGILTKK